MGSKMEFKTFWKRLDLDGNGLVTKLEVETYFNRNRYLVCKPFATAMLKKHEKEVKAQKRIWHRLFGFFDRNGDRVLSSADISSFLYHLSDSSVYSDPYWKEKNTKISKHKWDSATRVYFNNLCKN